MWDQVKAGKCQSNYTNSSQKLQYGVNMENLKYFTADGAAANGAVSKLTNLKIQKCHNHGIHLGIWIFFYL